MTVMGARWVGDRKWSLLLFLFHLLQHCESLIGVGGEWRFLVKSGELRICKWLGTVRQLDTGTQLQVHHFVCKTRM